MFARRRTRFLSDFPSPRLWVASRRAPIGCCRSSKSDEFYFRKYKSVLRVFFMFQKDSPMTDAPSPRPSRSALSPAARALRLQRIFARLQRQLGRHRGRRGLFAGAAAADHPRRDGSGSRLGRAGPQADADGPPDAGFAPRRGRRRSGRRQIHPAVAADHRSSGPLFRPARGFQLARVVHGTATPAILEARKTGGKENRRRRPRPICRGASRMPIAKRARA